MNMPTRLTALAAGVLLACAVHAQTAPGARIAIDQPAATLDQALGSLARQTGVQAIFASALTEGRTAPALKGSYTPREALERLLAGSGLVLRARDAQTYTLERAASGASGQEARELATVTVHASADASAAGLPRDYAGGQVARGGRIGILGNLDIMDTPFNGTNYTQALIQDQQARSVADVMQNDPSVRVARGFGNFQELYLIRGFPVFSDDMSYNGLYGLLPRQYVAAELLERIEVFRGASTFVNGAAPGSSGIGGMVSVLPKRAPNEALTQLSAGIESGGQAYGALDVARRFGPDRNTGIRINAVRRDGGTAVDREKRELDAFVVGLDWRNDKVRLSADIGHQYHRLDQPRPSVTPDGGLPAAPDATKNFAQPWTYSEEKQTFGTLRGEFDLADDVTLWAAAGMREGDERNVLAEPKAKPDGTITPYRFDNHRQETVKTGEVGIRARLRTGEVGHQLSAAVSAYALEERNAWAMSGNFAAGSLGAPLAVAPAPILWTGGVLNSPLVVRKSETSSFALADTLSFSGDRILLTLGARHQTIEEEGFDYNTGVQTSSYKKSRVSPMTGLVVKATRQVSLYANYSEGLIKGDTAPFRDGNNNIVSNGGQAFAPYVAKQKEIGVKYDGGSLGGALSLFATSKPSGFLVGSTFETGGEQNNRGLELTVYGEAARGVRLLGGLTLLDAEQTKADVPANNGKAVIGVPRRQLNAGVEWDVPALRGLTLTGRAIHTSTQYADAANTMELPAWSRFDLGARYTTSIGKQALTLRARVDNVSNRSYWASAGGYPGQSYLVLGAPRTFVLTGTVDF